MYVGNGARYIKGGDGNNKVQQKNTLYLRRVYGEKVTIETECGLEGVHGMMGLEV